MVKQRTLLTEELSESTLRAVIRCAKDLLGGVGQKPSSVERMEVAIHYRRALTEAEYSLLTPAWCAIPAVHEAGHGEIIEVEAL
jgi:hypothetical protein